MAILKFAVGETELLALRGAGVNVQGKFGPQVEFNTTDGRTFWLDEGPASDVERELQELGVRPGTPFQITKHKASKGTGFWYTVQRTGAANDAGGHNVPGRGNVAQGTAAALPQTRFAASPDKDTPTVAPIAPASTKLMAAMCSLIDAMTEAHAYALRRGLTLTTEDLRALAVTAFIQDCKGGGR
jgi:hypothetical protein